MFVHVREKVMFEVYGGESMSDQYEVFFCHLLSISHFAAGQLLCWPFLFSFCTPREKQSIIYF